MTHFEVPIVHNTQVLRSHRRVSYGYWLCVATSLHSNTTLPYVQIAFDW